MSSHELEIRDRDGCASLWIDGANVWDIAHKHVTDEVLDAIKSAWSIGRKTGVEEMKKFTWEMETRLFREDIWVDRRSARKEEEK